MSDALRFVHAAQQICAQRGLKYVAPVGSGAFKYTFHVTTKREEQKALKVYRSTSATPRVHREVDAIKRCNNEHIARFDHIEDVSLDGESYTYSLEEYLPGGNLTARLDAGPFDRRSLVLFGSAMINAIAHIASLRLVHRDVKPDNIMFRDSEMTPVIVDFGLVRDLDKSSLTRTWVMQGPGTPYYASPEQLNNDKHQIDWRTDQFALGVVLAICATGKHPYNDGDDDETVARVYKRDAPSAEFIAWTLKQRLQPIQKMVQPWPVRRYRTPQDLAAAWSELGDK